MKNLLTWLPRILAMLFAVFIAAFALDAFSEDLPFWTQVGHFFMHLLPSLSIVAILLIAWKFRILGGLLFMVLGMVFTIFFDTWKATSNFLLISLPLLATGLLFILSHWQPTRQ
ncbi:MAG: hypothetical protein AAB316_07810 [Bacteroidota bacterium]